MQEDILTEEGIEIETEKVGNDELQTGTDRNAKKGEEEEGEIGENEEEDQEEKQEEQQANNVLPSQKQIQFSHLAVEICLKD